MRHCRVLYSPTQESVISYREGEIQELDAAFRVYRSEVDVRDVHNPLDVLKAFVRTYGLTFKLGNVVAKFVENEIIGNSRSIGREIPVSQVMQPIEGAKGTYYCRVVAGAETYVQAPQVAATARVLFAFVIDISRYAVTMRRHKVQLTPEEHWKFPTI